MDERANVALSVYAGASGTESSGRWYEDDARTYAYETGGFNLLESKAVFQEDKLTLKLSYASKGMTSDRDRLDLQVKSMYFAPAAVQAGQASLEEAGGSWSYDEALRTLSLQVPNSFDEMELVIQG
nr:DUF5110 domain-containing protein [Cohnella sp. GbtcB17]